MQYLNNVFRNFRRSIWMIVLSMMVTLWIIQISLAERATNEAAIRSNSIVSLLHGPGIMIPNRLREEKNKKKKENQSQLEINYYLKLLYRQKHMIFNLVASTKQLNIFKHKITSNRISPWITTIVPLVICLPFYSIYFFRNRFFSVIFVVVVAK